MTRYSAHSSAEDHYSNRKDGEIAILGGWMLLAAIAIAVLAWRIVLSARAALE